jgi:hypothetical protein
VKRVYYCNNSQKKKGVKTDCNNYRGISLLSTSCTILSNILLSRLGPYIDEIIGDHQREQGAEEDIWTEEG